ncbi:MAG TPA: amino acid permease [Croceibacterium sp.]
MNPAPDPALATSHAEPASAARKLGLVAAIALVMGNMIGSGVFLLPASLAPFGWNAVGGWIAAIAGALVLAWVFARLAHALPDAGGAVGFVHRAFGHVPAFLVSWVYLVSNLTALVTLAVAAISYLSSLVPAIGDRALLPALLAVGMLWTMTALNLLGVRAAGVFQTVTTLVKVIPLLLVIALAAGALTNGSAEFAPFDPAALSLDALAGAAALTMFALLGFEAASFATDKVRDPETTVPRATMIGTLLTGMLYLVVSSAIALLLPAAIASSSPAPFATFIERFWSGGPAALVAVFAIVSCVGALNGWTLIQGELVRTMAAQGLLPAWFGRTNARGVASRALIVSAVACSVLALINASGTLKALFEFLLLLATSASLWFYLAIAVAALRLGVSRPLAALGVVFALATLWGAGIGASGLSLVLMVAGLPLYWWARSSRKRGSAEQAV